jgi:hypothetical protein
MMRFGLGVLAYAVPTFALGFVWHLILFEDYYHALRIYRDDIIVPFGFLAILTQGVLFAWIYDKMFARSATGFAARALAYGALGALLSWSFTTITVAAKNIMASAPNYLLIETAFTLAQWVIVAPLTVFAMGMAPRPGSAAAAIGR